LKLNTANLQAENVLITVSARKSVRSTNLCTESLKQGQLNN